MFSEQYETHADMLNHLARLILDIFAAIRKIYAAFNFTPPNLLG